MNSKLVLGASLAALLNAGIVSADWDFAGGKGIGSACKGLPSHAALKTALDQAVSAETSGLNLHMWATIVNRDGVVCAVAYSGINRAAQWPASRVISAQKANTANSLSLDSSSASAGSGMNKGLALSTANLYSAVQPGGSLFGLQESNPVNTEAAYGGNQGLYGTPVDPLVGKKSAASTCSAAALVCMLQGKPWSAASV